MNETEEADRLSANNIPSNLAGESGVLIADWMELHKSQSIRGLMGEVFKRFHNQFGDERELLVIYMEEGDKMKSLVWVERTSGGAIGGGFFPYNDSQQWIAFDVKHNLDDSERLFTSDCGLLVNAWSDISGEFNVNLLLLSGGRETQYSSVNISGGVNCMDDLKPLVKKGSLLEEIMPF
jgi:hypothetical protein